MRNLNIPLDDSQYKKLRTAKIDYESDTKKVCSWQRFLMLLLKAYEGEI